MVTIRRDAIHINQVVGLVIDTTRFASAPDDLKVSACIGMHTALIVAAYREHNILLCNPSMVNP